MSGRGRVGIWLTAVLGLANPMVVMQRDARITGTLRGQSDAVAAPAGFEGMFCSESTLQRLILSPVNSQWKVSVPNTWQFQPPLTNDRPSLRFCEIQHLAARHERRISLCTYHSTFRLVLDEMSNKTIESIARLSLARSTCLESGCSTDLGVCLALGHSELWPWAPCDTAIGSKEWQIFSAQPTVIKNGLGSKLARGI